MKLVELVYVVVSVPDDAALARVKRAVARPGLHAYQREVRYWVETVEEAETERIALSLAGFQSSIANYSRSW
jgi:hypothetical protein